MRRSVQGLQEEMARSVGLVQVVVLFVSLAAVSGDETANPLLQPYGLGLSTPKPLSFFETGCDAPIYLLVGNDGDKATGDVGVALSVSSWGVSFRDWTQIGKATVSVPASSEETVEMNVVARAEDQGLRRLRAQLMAGDGGNANEADDTTQSSQEVLFAGASDSYLIPFGMGDGFEDFSIESIHAVSFGCVMDDGTTETTVLSGPGEHSIYCGDNEVLFEMPDVNASGAASVPAGGEIFGKLSVNFGALVMTTGGNSNNGEGWRYSDRSNLMAASGVADVVVQAVDSATGEQSHVIMRFVHTDVESLLSAPHLCAIKSVRTRVALETELTAALSAYESEEYDATMLHMVRFMDKIELIKCDLDCDEAAAVEEAMLAVGDAARMVARQGFRGPEVSNLGGVYDSDVHRRERYHQARARRLLRHLRRR